jgi:hypothetical protein
LGWSAVTPAQASYEARRASFWRRHGMALGDPLPWIEQWERLSDDQRADEEAGMLAGIRVVDAALFPPPHASGIEFFVTVRNKWPGWRPFR